MPQERLPKQALLAKANGKRLLGRCRTKWNNYIMDLGWNRLGFNPGDMMDTMENREVWRLKCRADASANLTEKRAMKKQEEEHGLAKT